MKTAFFYFTFCILLIACNETGNKTENLDSDSTAKTLLPPSDCPITFYNAEISESVIHDILTSHGKRLIFNFYEEKNGAGYNVKLQGWVRPNNLNTEPAKIPITVTTQSALKINPVHFLNIEWRAAHDATETNNIYDNLHGSLGTNFKIGLEPYDAGDGYIGLNAYLIKSNGDTAFNAKAIKINPCPPKKPQG